MKQKLELLDKNTNKTYEFELYDNTDDINDDHFAIKQSPILEQYFKDTKPENRDKLFFNNKCVGLNIGTSEPYAFITYCK